jgi:hypothetical protein
MKKLVLTSVCALATAGAAFAQGNVNWGSISFSSMTAQTNSTAHSPFTGGGSAVGGSVGAAGGSSVSGANFYYELLYSAYSGTQAAVPTTLAALGTWSDAGLGATNAPTAGRLYPINPNTGAQVPWSPGVTNSIMMAGWSANLGTTWAAVKANLNSQLLLGAVAGNAFFGLSQTGYITPFSTSTIPGATVFGTAAAAWGLPINSLLTQLYLVNSATPVPEPATLALVALGGAALLFRRKK